MTHRSPDVVLVALVEQLRATAGALDGMLRIVTELSAEILGGERTSVRLLDESRTRLLVAARTGSAVHETDPEFRVGEGLAGWVVAHGRIVHVDDAEADIRFVPKLGQVGKIGAFAGVPLADSGKAIGVLAASSVNRAFTPTDVRWLQVVAGIATPYLDVARLNRIAITDELTLALNRRALDALIPQPTAHDGLLSVVLFDVDNFKAINDRRGHNIGDEVLRVVSQQLRALLRRGDELVRLGGDEFLVVLRDVPITTAHQVAERALAAVSGGEISGFTVTLSAGVAERSPRETRESLLDRADRALYRAKADGRNRVALR
jgi:diguanylate cyclase (GGDEF)-like protein